MTEPSSPARRTRAEARLETRERLLAAAADVFRRQGYNGASLEAVAEAAGYTKGAVYSNFATKADLFVALIERYIATEAAHQREAYQDGPVDAFVNDLDRIFEHQTTDDPGWITLQIEFWLAAVRDPAIAAKLTAGARADREAEGRVVDQELAAAGITSPFTGLEIGILVNALASGLALQRQLEPDAFDPKLLVRAARLIVGLDPDPPAGT